MNTFRNFTLPDGTNLIEEPNAKRMFDFTDFWLLSKNLHVKDGKQENTIVTLGFLVDDIIKYIALYSDVEKLTGGLGAVQQDLLANLYMLKETLEEMNETKMK